MLKPIRLFFIIFSLSILFYSCQNNEEKKIKYTFLFIGDGMGVAQVNLTEAYLAAINNEKRNHALSFTSFPHAGLVDCYANNRYITGSAAAATAFATGNKTNIGRIATDTSGQIPFFSIASICKENGMKTGIISSVSIDHATPAAFYAHQPSRNKYFEIGIDLANSDIDFFGGGGLSHPEGVLDGEKVNAYEMARENDFTFINSSQELMNLQSGDGKIIAVHPQLLEDGSMPYTIDNHEQPTLANFTEKAIEILDNNKGFFMMVEGGKIDWACHSNDAASTIHEMLAFDDAVKVALEFYKKHPDETLIVVTADHETGGMALGTGNTGYESHFQYLQYQKVSYDEFNNIIADFQSTLTGDFDKDLDAILELTGTNFGLGKEIPITEEEKSKIWFAFEKSIKDLKYDKESHGDYHPEIKIPVKLMSEKAGVGWATHSHTGINVPVYAIGPGAELFSGVIDNTDIPKIMMQQMGIE